MTQPAPTRQVVNCGDGSVDTVALTDQEIADIAALKAHVDGVNQRRQQTAAARRLLRQRAKANTPFDVSDRVLILRALGGDPNDPDVSDQ